MESVFVIITLEMHDYLFLLPTWLHHLWYNNKFGLSVWKLYFPLGISQLLISIFKSHCLIPKASCSHS